MARERRRDGRGTVAPPQRVEVGLTSVCVRRGSVQLPFRLQGVFAEGPVEAADADGGVVLDLRLRAPRELLGLGAFFEHYGLGVNDAIALVFDGATVRIAAVKRERRPAGRAERADAGAAPPSSRPSVVSGRRNDTGREAPPAQRREHSSQSAAPSAPPTLRMEVPEASVPADVARPEAGAGDRAGNRWQPLDVTITGDRRDTSSPAGTEADAPGPDGGANAATTWVREVRRRPASAPPAGVGASDGPTRPSPPQGREIDAAGRAPEPTAPTPDAIPDGDGDRADGGPEAQAPTQGRGLDLLGLRRRLGIGRAASARVVANEADVVAGTMDAQRPAHSGARTERTATEPSDQGIRRPAARAGGGDAGPTNADALLGGQVLTGVHGTAPSASMATSTTPVATVSPAPADEDVRAVAAYLTRTDIPAIVRAERVADELGLPVARADAALDRIAEDSERLSRIRARAYMVRRRDQG